MQIFWLLPKADVAFVKTVANGPLIGYSASSCHTFIKVLTVFLQGLAP